LQTTSLSTSGRSPIGARLRGSHRSAHIGYLKTASYF